MQAPETVLDAITGEFFRTRIFTPARTALLAAQLPVSDADAAARRDHEAAALAAQIKKLDAQQDAQVRALEDVPDGPADKAMRAASTSGSPRCTPSDRRRGQANRDCQRQAQGRRSRHPG